MKNKIKISGKDNFNYDVLCTFESKETNKNFVLYTDYSKDVTGELNIFSACYNKDMPSSKLLPVTDENELKIVNNVISELQNSMLSGMGNS